LSDWKSAGRRIAQNEGENNKARCFPYPRNNNAEEKFMQILLQVEREKGKNSVQALEERRELKNVRII
jgi:hypothetical protein